MECAIINLNNRKTNHLLEFLSMNWQYRISEIDQLPSYYTYHIILIRSKCISVLHLFSISIRGQYIYIYYIGKSSVKQLNKEAIHRKYTQSSNHKSFVLHKYYTQALGEFVSLFSSTVWLGPVTLLTLIMFSLAIAAFTFDRFNCTLVYLAATLIISTDLKNIIIKYYSLSYRIFTH